MPTPERESSCSCIPSMHPLLISTPPPTQREWLWRFTMRESLPDGLSSASHAAPPGTSQYPLHGCHTNTSSEQCRVPGLAPWQRASGACLWLERAWLYHAPRLPSNIYDWEEHAQVVKPVAKRNATAPTGESKYCIYLSLMCTFPAKFSVQNQGAH